ncbi:MAG TPA: SRPBCC family protein, partial [Candidatus Competibacteraceae bacterium]|nr:SRPBCC family protein [Candidatus Competibacteraceae bacterium]
MAKHFEKSILPYTQEQLFELVADVERYPEFVP